MSDTTLVLKKQSAPIIERANAIVVTNAAEMNEAAEVLSQLNQFMDRLTEEKEKVTKPLNEALEAERARWKPLEDMYNGAITTVRGLVSTYMTAEAKRVKEAEAKIVARVGDGKGKLQMDTAARKLGEIAKPEEKVVAKSGMLKFRTVIRLNILQASDIPREYLVPDEKAILAALKEGKKVKGCVIIEEQSAVNYR